MEQFSSPHRKESGINKITGFEPGNEATFLRDFKNRFDANVFGKGEKEKTPEQLELIGRINRDMKRFLSQYGVDSIEIPAGNIHILDRSQYTADELTQIEKKFNTKNGFYSPRKQGLAILKDYDAGKLPFLQTLVHELLHMQGFYSYQKSELVSADATFQNTVGEKVGMNTRRSGFSIGTRDGKTLLFHKLNEAIITELEIRFEKTYMQEWPELTEEVRVREEYTKEIARQHSISFEKARNMVASIKNIEGTAFTIATYPYDDDREQFNSLLDTLYERNAHEFASREDVFALFARATMAGQLLPVARLVEKTFGKGSFREIAEKNADTQDVNTSTSSQG